MEYLGFLITIKGIKLQPKKVEAIHNMAPPKKRKDVRKFLGIVNYYRDMLEKRSDILAPLSRLTSKKVPFEWGKKEQTAFEKIKMIMSKDTLLTYLDFPKHLRYILMQVTLNLGQ